MTTIHLVCRGSTAPIHAHYEAELIERILTEAETHPRQLCPLVLQEPLSGTVFTQYNQVAPARSMTQSHSA